MAISLKKSPKTEEPTPPQAPTPAAEAPPEASAAPAQPAQPAPTPPPAPAPMRQSAEESAAPVGPAEAEAEGVEGEDEEKKKTLSPKAQKALGVLKKISGPLGKFYASSPKRFFALLGGAAAATALAVTAVVFWEKYQYTRVMSNYEDGKFVQAAEGFNDYLLINPNDTGIMRMLAVTHFNAGQHDLAVRVLNRLQTNYTEFENHPEIWYRKALSELPRPGFGEASANLDHALEADGNYIPALYFRTAMAAGEGGHEEAKLAFERVIGLMNETPLSRLEALVLAREVDYINNHIFNRPAMALSSTPDLPTMELTAPVPLGARTGLQVDAAGFDNRYYVPLPLPPESVSEPLPEAGMEQLIAVNLARQAIIGEGDLPTAREYVNRLAATPENKRFGGYLSGYLAALTGEYPLAISIYAGFGGAELHPLIMQGNAQWAQSMGAPPDEETIGLFRKALDLDASNSLALNNLGFFELYLGNEDEALTFLLRSFESHPGEKSGLNLALIEIERGNAQEARTKLYSLVESVGEDNLVLTRALVIAELALGLDKSAADGLKRWKELEPDSPTPYLIAAEIHRRSGQQLLRLHELEEGLKLFPRRHEFSANLALAHLGMSDPKAAQSALQKTPDSARDNFLVMAARAMLTGRENPEEAAKLFARAQAETPLAETFRLAEMRARFLIENDRPQQAQQAISEALEKVGGDSVPPFLRALELRIAAATDKDAGDQIAAEAEEMIAKSEAGFHGDRIVDLARALMEIGNTGDGVAHLEALLEQAPHARAAQAAYEGYVKLGRSDDAAALKRRLEHLAGTAEVEERTDIIKNAETFIIGSPSDFLKQINAALAANDAVKAVALYSQVIETGKPKLKNSSKTHLNRGSLYFVLKKYAEAADDFAKAEQLGQLEAKEEALRSYQHAFALQRMARHKDAIVELEKALAFDEKNLQYRSLYGHLLRRAERLDEAEAVLKALLRESPLQESAYFELADMQRRERNNNNAAIRTLQDLVEVAPRNKRAHRILADLFVSNGQPEKADQHREILRTL